MFDSLSRTFSSIFSKFSGQAKLTEKDVDETLKKVHDALLEADVPYQLVQDFCADIKQDVIDQNVLKGLKPAEQLINVVHERLKKFLGGDADEFVVKKPATLMVMGLQGSGKTTTLAKLARWIRKRQRDIKKVLAASVDFYRPAAIDQLEVLAKKARIDFYRSPETNPVDAAQDIARYARSHGYDLVLLDTAGRLHVDETLLKELQAIDKAVKPAYKIMVLDAMTGQESLTVAQSFDKEVGFSRAILTKVDSDSRGGAAFSFRYALKKPIVFVGTGEKLDNFEKFRPERVAGRILGMGDLASLAEKAEEKIQQSEQERLNKAFMSGTLTLEDFSQQLAMVNRLGSLSGLMKYMPGMGGMQPSQDMVEQGERDLKKFNAIISSMTRRERNYPKILDSSRKRRVARGAGVDISDVTQLLERFDQMKQFAKQIKQLNRFGRFFK